ncbi:MAG: ABC transporter permease [Planctomycetes bacterium]|nr:ABC transporter permease [Planctomycetota bacterium]
MSFSISMLAAQKDWRRLWRDPWKLLLWIGIPIVIGTLMTTVMGGSGNVQPRAVLYLEDQDDTMLSGFLVGAFSNEQIGDMIDVIRMPHEQALERLNDNDGSAALLIPAGFQDAVMEETPITLQFVTNPAQRILPGILAEVLAMLQQGVFYIHRVFGDEIKLLRATIDDTSEFTLSDPAIANIAVQINSAMRSLEDYLNPVLIQLEFPKDEPEPATEEGQEGDGTAIASSDSGATPPKIPVSFYMMPSILLMALFFVAQGLSEDFWQEREAGTMKRFFNSPNSVATFLASKVLAAAGVYFVLGIVLIAIGYSFHSFIAWSTLPLAVLWWTAGGVGVFMLMSLIQMFAGSRRGGSLITNLLMFPLLMVGGSFFPFEAMPDWMATVGQYTPNGWILQQLKPILLQQHELAALSISFVGLFVASAVLFFILRQRITKIALGA